MKINPLNDAALAAAATGAVRTERGTATAAPQGVPDAAVGGSVTVSSAARSLEVSSAGSGIDHVKVAAMRAAIADGSFTVNAGHIADKLLSTAQEFLSRARS